MWGFAKSRTMQVVAPALLVFATAEAEAQTPVYNSASATNGAITVRADALRFSGAISSVYYRRFQYVDTHDHGRELQSAVSFDHLGECWNPTEAGSRVDGSGRESSSEFLGGMKWGTGFSMRTLMANWLAPGDSVGCSGGAVNPTVVSPHVLAKTITVGAAEQKNVIRHAITFEINESHDSATFEALTLYTKPSLSKAWTYDPATKQLTEIAFPQAEQGLPIILATPNGRYATGVWSSGLPQASYPGAGYGAWYFPLDRTAKWNCVYRVDDIPPGIYTFVAYSIFGSLAEVTAAMDALYARAQ